jgi:hypothetical protein
LKDRKRWPEGGGVNGSLKFFQNFDRRLNS